MDIQILIADTQVLTREGIIALLTDIKGINIAGIADSIESLKHLIMLKRPDVIILDHNYRDHLGINDLKNIGIRFDLAKILILSNRQTRSEILELIDLGIKNYICKDCTHQEIIDAIYATAKGETFFCESTRRLLNENSNEEKNVPQLSTRETEIVQLIAEGMTNKEISERLFLSIHTVKTHRKNIIKKLGFTFKNAADLMLYTSKRGN